MCVELTGNPSCDAIITVIAAAIAVAIAIVVAVVHTLLEDIVVCECTRSLKVALSPDQARASANGGATAADAGVDERVECRRNARSHECKQ